LRPPPLPPATPQEVDGASLVHPTALPQFGHNLGSRAPNQIAHPPPTGPHTQPLVSLPIRHSAVWDTVQVATSPAALRVAFTASRAARAISPLSFAMVTKRKPIPIIRAA